MQSWGEGMGSKVGSWSQGVQWKVDIVSSVVHCTFFFKFDKYQTFLKMFKHHFLTSVFYFNTLLHVTWSRMPWRLAPQLMRSCKRQSSRPKRHDDSSTRRGFEVKWCNSPMNFPCCLQEFANWNHHGFPGFTQFTVFRSLNQAALARLTAAEQSGVTLATTGRDVPVAGWNKTKARGNGWQFGA